MLHIRQARIFRSAYYPPRTVAPTLLFYSLLHPHPHRPAFYQMPQRKLAYSLGLSKISGTDARTALKWRILPLTINGRWDNPGIILEYWALYKSMVRPHLEFCSPAWNSYYVNDRQLLERVQHRFTQMFSDLKSLPCMKIDCGLETERRNSQPARDL